jgi:UDP-N-acetylglucosamine 2-epimerase (non-hydrolysing)
MPEEVNRVIADQVSDLAFAPTETAAENLTSEGVVGKVEITGNTIVDACREHVSIAADQSSILDQLDVANRDYIVATIHRPLNTDNDDRLKRIFEELDTLNSPVIFPAHPRTQNQLKKLNLSPEGSLKIVSPLDYLDFLKLQSNAKVIVTDSGGIQEEASILEIPCLTVRPNTERPETVEAGVNRLVEPDEIRNAVLHIKDSDSLYQSMQGHTGLYGDGRAGQRIASIVVDFLRK